MAKVTYYPSQVRLRLNITPPGKDTIQVPITDFDARFSLNALPTATVKLAIGVDAANPSQRAGAHLLPADIKRGTRAEVWCALEGVAGPMNGTVVAWPGMDKPFRVFDGYVQTAGPEAGNGLRSSIGLIHWAGQLDESHWLCSMLDPGAPESLTRASGFAYGEQKYSETLDQINLQKISTVLQDIWLKALKPSLIAIAGGQEKVLSQIQIGAPLLEALYGTKPYATNAVMSKALERMDDAAHMVVPTLAAFKGAEQPADLVATYAATVAREFWSMEGSGSLWSKLLRFASLNLLATSIGVETGTFVPLIPVLDRTWVELAAEEIWSVAANPFLLRTYRGTVLLPRGAQSFAGSFNANAGKVELPPTGRSMLSGFYDVVAAGIPKELIGESPGALKIEVAPPWLAVSGYKRSPYEYAKQVRSGRNPQEPDAAKRTRAQAAATSGRVVGDALAKYIFMSEVFKARAGAMLTRLRFDTAPGSTIKFYGGNPSFNVPGLTQEGATAVVATTMIHISASANTGCSTSFEFFNMRLAHEAAFNMTEHPIFGTYWRGSPLINIPNCTPPLTL